MKDTITITLIGESYSGKTNLTERYVYNQYNKNNMSTFYQCCEFSGKKIKIELWDTPGAHY